MGIWARSGGRAWPLGLGLGVCFGLVAAGGTWSTFAMAQGVTDTAVGPDPLPADRDGDGLSDAADPCPDACDCDGDGLSDPVELGVTVAPDVADPSIPASCGVLLLVDADPNRTSDPLRRDTDGGGLDDGQEDLDRDGALDALETDPSLRSDDVDGDGDGWPDAVEGDADPEGDDRPASSDDDSDGDGLRDRDEPRRFALDGVTPTLLAADSDGDRLTDGLDGVSDVDGDGVPALLDLDSDGDGLPDEVEGALDLDGDDKPNFLDTNSDGDRATDAAEANTDLDCDGVLGPYDADDQSGFCEPPMPGAVDTAAFDAPLLAPTPPPAAGGCDHTSPSGALWVAGVALLSRRRRR